MDKDEKVLHWLSKNSGLTSECITEVIELFGQNMIGKCHNWQNVE